MNNVKKRFLVLGVLVSSTLASAASTRPSTFLPENDLWIPSDVKMASPVTEVSFNRIIAKVERIYAPIVQANGGELKIDPSWEDGTVNAYASQEGDTWLVALFGGLARHPLMTDDGLTMVICHELGHHLGGAPKGNWRWASIEGQADYYASLKCIRKVFADEDNISIVAAMEVPEVVTKKCTAQFSDVNDLAICQRTAMGALALASLLADLHEGTPVPNFSTPDPSIVTRTSSTHPAPQCRLDTMFQAALCEQSHMTNVSNSNHAAGTCVRGPGTRPLCWYKPANI
jgi:hypothetical protein